MYLLMATITATHIVLICIGAAVIAVLATMHVIRHQRSRQRKYAGFYVNALRELIRGDEDSAFQHLKVVVTRDIGNIDAYLKLGDIFRRRGELNKALQIHRQLTVRNDLNPSDRMELMKSLTLDYVSNEKWDRAVATLQELLSQDKRNLWGLHQLLELHERLGQWDHALDVQETIMKITGQKEAGIQYATFHSKSS